MTWRHEWKIGKVLYLYFKRCTLTFGSLSMVCKELQMRDMMTYMTATLCSCTARVLVTTYELVRKPFRIQRKLKIYISIVCPWQPQAQAAKHLSPARQQPIHHQEPISIINKWSMTKLKLVWKMYMSGIIVHRYGHMKINVTAIELMLPTASKY